VAAVAAIIVAVVTMSANRGWTGTSVEVALIVVALIAVGIALTGYARSARHAQDCQAMAAVADRVLAVDTASASSDVMPAALLGGARGLLRAREVWLYLMEHGDRPAAVVHAGASGSAVDDGRPITDALFAPALSGNARLYVRGQRGLPAPISAALCRRGVDRLATVPVRDDGGDVIGVLEVSSDRRLRRRDLPRVEAVAEHLGHALVTAATLQGLREECEVDRLTGLVSANHYATAVYKWQRTAGVAPQSTAIAVFSVDTYDELNDSLGYDAVDDLLRVLADRLRAATPSDAPVARIGHDSIAVTMAAAGDRIAAEQVAAIQAEVDRPCDVLNGMRLDLPLTVGIARGGRAGGNVDELLRSAEVALYHARRMGASPTTYSPALDARRNSRLRLVVALREALEQDQVGVVFQPMISLRTNQMIGVEALARWNDPRHGPISPERFVSAAERSGLIGGLTRYVLARALQPCRHWLDQGRRIGVSVNLSARSLLDEAFIDDVAELLGNADVPPGMLTFELTERNVISEPERALPNLHRLRRLGVRLSVDDFGTGYSSLGYLRRLPIDEVKIDKTLVLGMASDLGGPAMVRAIVELGHSLGLSIVAEGVEDQTTRDLLTTMGCDVIQGYLVSRGLPAEQLNRWMQGDGEASMPHRPSGAHVSR